MAIEDNNTNSNITNKVARIFLAEFEKMRVVSKTINTQLITPEFTPQFGDTVGFKRPHQYRSFSTPGGDLTGINFNNIISGKADAKIQEQLTVPIEWTSFDESTSLDQLQDILKPAASQLVTDLETAVQDLMIQNLGLSFGTVGDPLTTWGDIADFSALMHSIGVPGGMDKFCAMNPFQIKNLADTQTGLASGNNNLVTTAWEDAQISTKFGGLRALMSNSMSTYTSGLVASGDLAGVQVSIAAAQQEYVTVKDTMTQTITLTVTDSATLLGPGDIIELTAVKRLNPRTRKIAFDSAGAGIPWRYTVVAPITTGGTTQTYTVSGAAIFEGGGAEEGQYNNSSEALPTSPSGNNAIIRVPNSGTPTLLSPSLFYGKDVAGIGFIRQTKLHTWDTIAETNDGVSLRITKYSDGTKNTQQMRADLVWAYATLNPSFGGAGWGQ